MGRQQIYKGDPSLKQYYLIDDFSGGINTTSVDERTSDNEFRQLLNVELSKKGMIQNRKGWGQFSLLNNFIKTKNINNLPTNNFALIKVVKNNGNLLQILADAQNQGLIEGQFTLPSFYELEILFIYEQNGIKLGLLELYSPRQVVTGGPVVDPSIFKVIANIEAASFSQNKSLLNIETVDYTDFIYFSLSSLNSSLIGFGEYNVFEKTFRIIRDDERLTGTVAEPASNIYKPNAYEVSKIGFNVLSNNPLTDIAERAGVFTISGLFLTTHQTALSSGIKTLVDTKTPIFSIPPTGKVTLNVLYTGDDVDAYNFTLEFYTPTVDKDGLPTEKKLTYVVDATKVEDGLAQFAVSVDLQNLPQVSLRIKLFSGITLESAKTAVLEVNKFTSTTALINYFNEAENTFFVSPDTTSSNRLFLNKKTSTPYLYTAVTNISIPGFNFTIDSPSPIYDDTSLTSNKKWIQATKEEYDSSALANKRSITLQQMNNNTATFGCNDFEGLSAISINSQNSDYYLAATDPVNYLLRVERTYLSESVPTTPVWQTATEAEFTAAQTNQNLWSATGATFATATEIAALTPAQIGTYFSSTQPTAVVRLEGTYTPAKFWEEISNPGSQNNTIYKDMPLDSGCPYLANYSQANLGLPSPASSTYTNGYVMRVAGRYSATVSSGGSWSLGGSSGTLINYHAVTGAAVTSSCPTNLSAALPSSGDFNGQVIGIVSSYNASTSNPSARYLVATTNTNYNRTTGYNSPNLQCDSDSTIISTLNSYISQGIFGAPTFNDGDIIRIEAQNDAGDFCGYTYARGVVPNTTSQQSCPTVYYTWQTSASIQTVNCTSNYRYFIVRGGVATATTPRYVYAKLSSNVMTSTLLCDINAYPESYKYFKVADEGIGFTTPAIVYALDGGVPKLYYKVNNVKTQIYYYPSTNIWSTTPNVTTVKSISNIALKQPNLVSIYYAGTNVDDANNYYRYTGQVTGNFAADFTNVAITNAAIEVEYNDIYEVAAPENPKPVEQLNTAGFRILEIGARLVLYKDNIIWFSDLYQFDYIPNYNFIILPLTPDDTITSINYFKGSYMIFTKERIYKLSGTFGGQDFQVQLVSDAIGCISPYSVKPFNNTLVFMSADGLYRIKQNYYSGGLENVEKIDKQLDNITPYNRDVFAVLNNEQYMLYYKYNTPTAFERADFNLLKMYYNMDAPQGYPYVKDKNSIQPPIVAKFDNGLYSIKDGLFYKYEIGYTDFLPANPTAQQIADANYTTKIRTSKLFFYYPTHDKKLKSIFVKTNAIKAVPIYFNVYIDDRLAFTYRDFKPERQPDGTIIYQPTDTPTLEAGNTATLGTGNLLVDNDLDNFNVSEDKLGDFSTKVHKIIVSAKGKGISLEIEQRTDDYFGIQDIGYLYKMGKAREDR
jgi:hypothetical protein